MSFVQQREKRANAGSRMRALLDQEADMEELFELDESEDEAFSETEEEVVDTIDSDFDLEESEGEEEQEQLAQEEEKLIRQEERQARRPQPQFLQKPTKTMIPKPTISAHDRIIKKVGRPSKKQQTKTQQSTDFSGRQSLRTKTILNRMQIEEQLRENEFKKALLPKRSRPKEHRLTQEELLAEAAITEGENLASLEQWQQKEAERQAKAKVKVKRGIEGPFIRYHSFTEGNKEERPKRRKLVMIMDDKDGNTTQMDIVDPVALEFQYRRDVEECDLATRNLITFFQHDDNEANNMMDDQNKMTKNKLLHINTEGLTDRELDRLDRIPSLASWADRTPRTIKPLPCPISGKEARYREPMTSTPYSNAISYTKIIDCLKHNYIWSPSLGIYTSNEADSKGAEGVPEGWERMVLGKQSTMEQDWEAPFPSWLATVETKSGKKRQRIRTQSS
ncbi:YL1 nuclear protein-domain-containing protein [Halteromyces radiatus]|uniref:YL1 nuclear protein-domain-containing protein n=1 Tax=Halteromyces radiatus TaxID=101107 RepID=UPI00221F941E|nr:YL1 nuclear protein-domain-containing protein [Halteromyces radiatus]KAI8086292.1 YL1 nuclear protein-domain-containing protein [Halteromyces radiatus]